MSGCLRVYNTYMKDAREVKNTFYAFANPLFFENTNTIITE